MLSARGLATGYPGRTVGRGIDLDLRPGEVVCLLGPNGGGKTTLFKTLLGLLPPLAGSIELDGAELANLARAAIARRVAYVPQAQEGAFPFIVRDIVLMGRATRIGLWRQPGGKDVQAASAALGRLGIAAFADRPFTALSGGERQLVLIARALAQEAGLCLMDEPMANLDLGNRTRLLAHLLALRREGIGILFTSHEPDHALAVADRVLLLKDGRVAAEGPPAGVMTGPALSALYGLPVEVVELGDGRRMVTAQPASNPSSR